MVVNPFVNKKAEDSSDQLFILFFIHYFITGSIHFTLARGPHGRQRSWPLFLSGPGLSSQQISADRESSPLSKPHTAGRGQRLAPSAKPPRSSLSGPGIC